MPISTVTINEYAIDWGDELEEGFESAEEAADHIAACVRSYTEQGWDLDPIKDARVVSRTVKTVTRSSTWQPTSIK